MAIGLDIGARNLLLGRVGHGRRRRKVRLHVFRRASFPERSVQKTSGRFLKSCRATPFSLSFEHQRAIDQVSLAISPDIGARLARGSLARALARPAAAFPPCMPKAGKAAGGSVAPYTKPVKKHACPQCGVKHATSRAQGLLTPCPGGLAVLFFGVLGSCPVPRGS